MGEKINKELLIELVRNEPGLWNKREKIYNNRDLKPDLWERIGKTLNTTGKVAQKSWETLRDSYRKIRKRAQSDGSPHVAKKDISWPHYEAMCFLDDMLVATPKESYPGLMTSPKREPMDERFDYESMTTTTTTTTTKRDEEECYVKEMELEKRIGRNRKRKCEDDPVAERRKVHLVESRPRGNHHESDDDYLFLMSLLPYLKKLDDVQKMRLRMEILRSVTEELENSKYQEVSASTWHPTAFAAVSHGVASSSNSSYSSRPATPTPSPGNLPDGHLVETSKRQRHGFVNTTGT